ncbi:nucleotidyltransferase domain-containing protein [Niallia sp. 03190]|uniref:nucleotidyltransferase domain-containing protein n=1 Tax=Niallia sp. 03190 TaxID=3458061 RepID=UPI004044CB91
MKEIQEQLNKIEEDYQVKILYACESGSRSWGFPSADSDFDVRFIYMHKKEWYLSLDKNRDVIELPIKEKLDIYGWELTKTLRLFRQSNPSLFEWMQSNIVYTKSDFFIEKIKSIKQTAFNPRACFYHYLHMAKNNFRDNLQKEEINIKKYFYVLRPILACCWIEGFQTMPSNDFKFLLNELIPNGVLKNKIGQLLQEKLSGGERQIEPHIPIIHQYVERELERLENVSPTINRGPINEREITIFLDDFFREILNKYSV